MKTPLAPASDWLGKSNIIDLCRSKVFFILSGCDTHIYFLMLLFIVVYQICPLIQEHFLCSPLLKCEALLASRYELQVVQLSPKFPAADPGGGFWGVATPPFGKFSNLSGYLCLSLFHAKNNIVSYINVSFSQIDHYKNTVAIPLLDSLIIQMQG